MLPIIWRLLRSPPWFPIATSLCSVCLWFFQFSSILLLLPDLTYLFSSVQFSRSVVFDSVSPWTAAHQAPLSITNSQNLLKLMSIESVMPSNHLILCCPLLLLPSIFPSTGVFSNETALCIRWPNYWSFSFSISPSNEHPGLIFRMDGLYLLDDLMFLVPLTVGFYSFGPGLTPQMTSGPRSTHLTCGYSQLKPFMSSDTLYLFSVAGVTNYCSFRNFKVSL